MSYTLSPRSLSLYAECARCFWKDLNEGTKRPSGPFPSLPGGMDAILKRHFDSHMERGELPQALKELEGEYALFTDTDLLRRWRNNRQGLRWTVPGGDALQGAIDNVLQRGDELVVLDYKTRGFALKEDTAEHYRMQMDIYNLLLRKEGHRTADHSLLLFYYPRAVEDDGRVSFNTQLVRLPVDVERAERLFYDALASLRAHKPEGNCAYCSR